jgi:hypothetical protein
MVSETSIGVAPLLYSLDTVLFSNFVLEPVGFGEVGVHTLQVKLYDGEPAY